ncbi:MAG: hypothetical protein ACREFB_00140, partial [Stellaceae bacterium]
MCGRSQAADPQPYTVTIADTGDAALDKALGDASRLRALRKKAAVAPFALVTRARDDVGRFEAVLHSQGYYDAKVAITIDGHPIDDPTLAATLAKVLKGKSVKAEVTVRHGPLYRLGHVVIVGAVPANARAALRLAPGQP